MQYLRIIPKQENTYAIIVSADKRTTIYNMVSTYTKFIVMDLSFDHGKILCNKKQKANKVQQTFFVLGIHIFYSIWLSSLFLLWTWRCSLRASNISAWLNSNAWNLGKPKGSYICFFNNKWVFGFMFFPYVCAFFFSACMNSNCTVHAHGFTVQETKTLFTFMFFPHAFFFFFFFSVYE